MGLAVYLRMQLATIQRYKSFLLRQLKCIYEEGLPALLRKSLFLFFFILAVIVVIGIRLIRPFFLIRIGKLVSERIGHFAGNTEMYLSDRNSATYSKRTHDLFFCSFFVSNHQLLKMWSRHLCIHPFFYWLSRANRVLPGGAIHNIVLPSNRPIHEIQVRDKQCLNFTDREEYLGREYLKSVGLNAQDKFVCLYVRDSKYLNEVTPELGHRDWDYHDYRNASIRNHIDAIERLCEDFGYYVFRIGHLVEEELEVENSKIIDYAANGDRSDFLDIYLSGKCHFFIAAGGGITAVAQLFRRPIVSVNIVPVKFCQSYPPNLFIPKKLWSVERHSFLSMKEMYTSDIGDFGFSQDYKQAGIECIENTPNEIAAVVNEMAKRLNGTWVETEEDTKLQELFLDLFPQQRGYSKMGSNFLRDNRDLLLNPT
jgi:putative glycosyltransferase (TIGR04372 family)